MRYRIASHSRYTIYYHIAIAIKYRRKVLTWPKVDDRLKEAIASMAPFHDWIIQEMETDKDHLHILLSAPPRYSPSEIVKLIKTWSQRKIFFEHPEVRKYLWGGKLWSQGFYVSTISDNTTKMEISKYIKEQKKQLKQLGLYSRRGGMD